MIPLAKLNKMFSRFNDSFAYFSINFQLNECMTMEFFFEFTTMECLYIFTDDFYNNKKKIGRYHFF